METSEYLETVVSMHAEARRRGLFFQHCSDERLAGREITVEGAALLSFSSCSYLGLERHPALVEAVQDAVARHGTQFSSSRGYVSAPGYDDLESSLSRLFGGHALVTSSTTLGHQVALPVLVTEKDALVLDHQVHHSVQMAAQLVRASGGRVEVVRHAELERAVERVAELAKEHRTVWFAGDGVYSMYGDLAPVGVLRRMLEAAPNVRLYIDDAHGMSWAGKHGRGSFLSRLALGERVVVATSLNKAFSAAGGCLVFPGAAERERVRMCGGPMLFSGPLQPPMLGAAIASARLHMSDEIVARQRALRDRVDRANDRILAAGLPLLVANESPIFFIRLGLPRLAFEVAQRLMAEGLYVNVSMYPAVPMKRAGLRLALTTEHSLDDVDRVVDGLARHIPAVLEEAGVTRAQVDELFAHAVPEEARRSAAYEGGVATLVRMSGGRAQGGGIRGPVAVPADAASGLSLEHARTIEAVDRSAWDAALGGVGACSHAALRTAEQLFSGQPRPEHNWEFHYFIVRDAAGAMVAATFFTVGLNKDDMLMRAEVSEAVERRRASDPYFLTSKVMMAGSVLSEGNHVFLDRRCCWREALALIVEAAHAEYDRSGANVLMLRDLPAHDAEMDEFLLDLGFVKVPMLDTHVLEVPAAGVQAILGRVSKRKRQYLREQGDRAALFTVRSHGVGSDERAPLGPGEAAHLERLYCAVAARKLKINVFPLPPGLVDAFLGSPAWEVVTLRLDPAAGGPRDGKPVAWFAAHVHDGNYAPFLCGLDYDHVTTHGAYRQALYQMVARAQRRGARLLHLGMDADVEKGRYGTRIVESCVYVQARDHWNGAQLREVVAEVGLQSPSLNAW